MISPSRIGAPATATKSRRIPRETIGGIFSMPRRTAPVEQISVSETPL